MNPFTKLWNLFRGHRDIEPSPCQKETESIAAQNEGLVDKAFKNCTAFSERGGASGLRTHQSTNGKKPKIAPVFPLTPDKPAKDGSTVIDLGAEA